MIIPHHYEMITRIIDTRNNPYQCWLRELDMVETIPIEAMKTAKQVEEEDTSESSDKEGEFRTFILRIALDQPIEIVEKEK